MALTPLFNFAALREKPVAAAAFGGEKIKPPPMGYRFLPGPENFLHFVRNQLPQIKNKE
jgi:hypothetical protein